MSSRIKTPHFVERDGSLRCSLCDMPLGTSADKALAEIFTEHVRALHKMERIKADFKPAAARIVREGTKVHQARKCAEAPIAEIKRKVIQ